MLSMPDHNHRRDLLLADQSVGGFIHLPLDAAEGNHAIEQILAVLQVENRISIRIGGRRRNPAAARRVACACCERMRLAKSWRRKSPVIG